MKKVINYKKYTKQLPTYKHYLQDINSQQSVLLSNYEALDGCFFNNMDSFELGYQTPKYLML
jgi:hypothetical protein